MQTQNNTSVNAIENAPAAQQVQIQEIRQIVVSQAAELKQQIQTIQQQVLQNMFNLIDQVFVVQLTNSLLQIFTQQNATAAGITDMLPNDSISTLTQPLNMVQQAINNASSSVDEAMKSAQQSVENAENILNNDVDVNPVNE